MARHIESVCKFCRREGLKLFLKGDRCYTDKCAFERRSYAPGQHGQRRSKATEYLLQLREKQKVKRIYGVMERQFRGGFKKAEKMKGITGENLLSYLERRLDNVVYRLGFADSRREARQLVMHGHFTVKGKTVNIPSYILKTDEAVQLKERSRKSAKINESLAAVERRGVPQWLELDKANYKGVAKALPKRDDIGIQVQEQLIVELYSK
ncbi:MAG: 30S ribosomal protein S4 [Deltaproteobacteria bacterium GWC2_42_11]|nr:MAG: 30S ribosomal protein S4 [Deltaproteobacteria bacterium GWC2_42_11]HBO83877.1 30S ribosomal protein S4 [Deltaproteobacteria bacterium]